MNSRKHIFGLQMKTRKKFSKFITSIYNVENPENATCNVFLYSSQNLAVQILTGWISKSKVKDGMLRNERISEKIGTST